MDDLFGHVPQPDRAKAELAPQPLTAADVKAKMIDLIATLRAAEEIPFPPAEFHRHVAMFPIMAQWLPGGEGEQLVMEFETEVQRLKHAA